MGEVVQVDFRKRAAADGTDTRVVSMTWNLDRSALLVWVIDHADRTTDEEVGTFYSHAGGAEAAADRAKRDGLTIVDHTAVDARGVWNHRPIAKAIHVWAGADHFRITIEPDAPSWIISEGSYPTLDVVGDRAVELSQALNLPVVDHVIGTP